MRQKILILDGAMGTMLQQHGLRGNNEQFNLTNPEVVRSIHDAYISAGADIISTNTFGANRINQAGFGCQEQASAFALEGARIARDAADASDRKIMVAGSMGPTGKSLSLSLDLDDPSYRDVSFDEMAAAYAEQVQALLEGGVDCLLLETCFDALNAKAAIYSIMMNAEAEKLPLYISASPLNKGGHLLTGQSLEGFWESVRHAHPACFGLNCSMGAEDLATLMGRVSSIADCAVSCYPNAGLPNAAGGYDQSPEQIASAMRDMALKGWLNVAGGCCGTTPDHIRAIAEALEGIPARELPVHPETGSEARALGIRLDDEIADRAAQMEAYVRSVATDPELADTVLHFDANDWDAALAGLKNFPGKCAVDCAGCELSDEQLKQIRCLGSELEFSPDLDGEILVRAQV